MKNYQMPKVTLIRLNDTDVLRTSGEILLGDPYVSAPDYWNIIEG